MNCNRNTTPMGDVVPMEIEYSQGRVNPNVTEFAMNEDGYDLMHDADGGDDFYDSDGGSSTGGDDFFNVSSDSPDAYMPDNFGGSNSAEDFYASNGDEDYSNLTLWSKAKRRKFGKKVQKGVSKGKEALGKISSLTQSLMPTDRGIPSPIPPPPSAPPSAPPPPKGMSTGVKVAIGVGVVVVGVIAYYLLKEK